MEGRGRVGDVRRSGPLTHLEEGSRAEGLVLTPTEGAMAMRGRRERRRAQGCCAAWRVQGAALFESPLPEPTPESHGHARAAESMEDSEPRTRDCE